MIVVETRPDGSFVSLAKEREMLRLGDLVARDGALGATARQRAFEVVRRFQQIAQTQQADQIVAVGTSALREAADGPAFVESVQQKLGVTIHIIDGIHEATTIFTAIRASVVIDPSPALALDLGGGSLEIMLGDAAGLDFAASAKLGVGRLTTTFFASDPPTTEELAAARDHVSRELEQILAEVAEFKPKLLIGSSGTFIAIATIAATLRSGTPPDHLNHLTVTYREIATAAKRVFAETRQGRTKIPGADARRAELLPAGFVVLLYIMERLDLRAMTISGWALREGLVLQTIAAHDPTDFGDDPKSIRRASVLSLCHRCNWNAPHGFQVAELAGKLFDATASIHGLDANQRELLECAALLHDIGEHISRTNHDRHSAYLIEHGDLRGFSPEEVSELILLARYHLRGSEKALKKDPKITVEQFDRLRYLIGLLRIADALDASHSEEITQISALERADGTLVLSLVARGEAELELWALRRKQGFFEQVSGLTCEGQVQRSRRKKLTPFLSAGAGLG